MRLMHQSGLALHYFVSWRLTATDTLHVYAKCGGRGGRGLLSLRAGRGVQNQDCTRCDVADLAAVLMIATKFTTLPGRLTRVVSSTLNWLSVYGTSPSS